MNSKIDAINQEYYFCQSAANDIDKQTMSFKNWSILLATGIFGWALTEGQWYAPAFACISAILFWYSEGLWKEKIKIYTDRVSVIEKILNEPKKLENYTGPKLSEIHMSHYAGGRGQYFPKRLRYLSVMLPHGVIFIAGIILTVLRAGGVN